MGRIHVSGGKKLCGETRIQGSKNAALPLMASSVLHKGVTIIHNCPRIQDVECMKQILEDLGCQIRHEDHTLWIDASVLLKNELRPELTVQMRGSVLLMGSLLGRCKEVILPFPGGCVIGARPVNYHMDMMRKMGAEVLCQEERMIFRTSGLEGNTIQLPFPSVGATENGILAAVLANGRTILKGCAKEPEIRELCCSLQKRGAKIKNDGDTIYLDGVTELTDMEYTLMPDRIVAGTYLLAACATESKIILHNVPAEELASLTRLIKKMGGHFRIWQEDYDQKMEADCCSLKGSQIYVKTAPYPGFPTDLQSQLMAAVAASEKNHVCYIQEEIFEKRFLIAEELRKMGADIRISGREAQIRGRGGLHAADLAARDLRGGAALVIAALAADGISRIAPDEYIKRGYENISRDLEELGATIHTELETTEKLPAKE